MNNFLEFNNRLINKIKMIFNYQNKLIYYLNNIIK